jgi:hypothetical protein
MNRALNIKFATTPREFVTALNARVNEYLKLKGICKPTSFKEHFHIQLLKQLGEKPPYVLSN